MDQDTFYRRCGGPEISNSKFIDRSPPREPYEEFKNESDARSEAHLACDAKRAHFFEIVHYFTHAANYAAKRILGAVKADAGFSVKTLG